MYGRKILHTDPYRTRVTHGLGLMSIEVITERKCTLKNVIKASLQAKYRSCTMHGRAVETDGHLQWTRHQAMDGQTEEQGPYLRLLV